MATTTLSGSTVTFSNSGAAAADLTNSTLTEDSSSLSLSFNVLAASGGGTNTTVYSVDDGTAGNNDPLVTTSKAFATHAPSVLSVNEGHTVALGITASAVEMDQKTPSILNIIRNFCGYFQNSAIDWHSYKPAPCSIDLEADNV